MWWRQIHSWPEFVIVGSNCLAEAYNFKHFQPLDLACKHISHLKIARLKLNFHLFQEPVQTMYYTDRSLSGLYSWTRIPLLQATSGCTRIICEQLKTGYCHCRTLSTCCRQTQIVLQDFLIFYYIHFTLYFYKPSVT